MFIVSDWLRSRSDIKIESFEVDDAKFELMNLTSDLFKEVVACESSSDMLDLAANAGISYDRNRVIDDPELSKDLSILWGLDGLKYNTEPSLRHKVGEKVCLMSGLSSVLEEMIVLEQPEETHLDGDNLPDGDVTLEQLEQDTQMHSHVA
jgi:hypothetical protein